MNVCKECGEPCCVCEPDAPANSAELNEALAARAVAIRDLWAENKRLREAAEEVVIAWRDQHDLGVRIHRAVTDLEKALTDSVNA